MPRKREKVETGSGAVYVDLTFAVCGRAQAAGAARVRINELIAEPGLTQAKAAALFGVPQPHVAELKNYKLSRVSSERLLRFLTLL